MKIIFFAYLLKNNSHFSKGTLAMNQLTIVIPAYNASMFLNRCVDSIIEAHALCPTVLHQLIIVDDGSTDNTYTLANNYAIEHDFILAIKQSNLGAGGARNTGIRSAITEYVAFVDSDDFISSSYFKHITTMHSDLIIFNCIKEDKKGSFNKEVSKINHFPLVCAIVKRQIYSDYNIYYPEKINFEDNVIAYALGNLPLKKVHINKYIYTYTYHVGSQSNNKGGKKVALDRAESSVLFYNHLTRLGLIKDNNLTEELNKRIFHWYMGATLSCFRKDGSYKLLKEIKAKMQRIPFFMPKEVSVKTKRRYFLLSKCGYLGYLTLCIAKINKIFR
jgi:glycosyltransferase involved in cell wall biosynthesis